MKQSLLQAIITFVMGYKYYANVINTRGTDRCELACFIFTSRRQAMRHRAALDTTLSFLYVETISFRSRKVLVTDKTDNDQR